MVNLLAVARLHWSKELASILLWASLFFTAELLPLVWAGCPWNTFTGTVRDAVAWWKLLAIWIAILFVILFGHFLEGWRARYLIGWAIITIIGVFMHVFLP